MIQTIIEVVMGMFTIFIGVRMLGFILSYIKINGVKK